jgi:hypothetical protein
MSRGFGRVERFILDTLTPPQRRGLQCYTAAELLDLLDPANRETALVSLRRALRRLLAADLIFATGERPNRYGLTAADSAAQRDRRRRDKRRAERERRRRQQWQEREEARIGEAARQQRTALSRLVRLLGMLGSDHDGEILAAAKAAEAERRRLELTWAEIIEPTH